MPKLIAKGSVKGELVVPVTLPVRIKGPDRAERPLSFIEAMSFFGWEQNNFRAMVSSEAHYEYSIVYLREIYNRFRTSRPVADILIRLFTPV